jgi:hypothetical protein
MLYSANMSKNKSFLKGTSLTFVSKWYSLSVFEYNKKTSFFVKNIKKKIGGIFAYHRFYLYINGMPNFLMGIHRFV